MFSTDGCFIADALGDWLVTQQESLGLDGSLTTGACRTDGLAVDGVGAVAGHEDAWQLGAWRADDFLQIEIGRAHV